MYPFTSYEISTLKSCYAACFRGIEYGRVISLLKELVLQRFFPKPEVFLSYKNLLKV